MRVDFEFYGTLRDAVGRRHLAREVAERETVEEALSEVADEHPGLRSLLFDAKGHIRPHITVFRNDVPIASLEGADTPLSAGDAVGATPGVAGGGEERPSAPSTPDVVGGACA